ncbi:MAG: hypothetical protein N3B16_12255, partial [Candidatus Aminicenantes bacterium]|nr:hypothetical protein [Candidatus Aminicenantes bacterium]
MVAKRAGINSLIVGLFFSLWPSQIFCQDWRALLEKIYPLASPSGYEHMVISQIKSSLPPDWPSEIDNLGSLIVLKGKADFLVAAPVDEIGYFVSGITKDGFLRLDRAVSAPHRFIDNYLMGQGVTIWTKKGPVQGLVAHPAVHLLSRERRDQLDKGVSLDDLFVDVGAKSEEEVKAKGIQMLDAVTRERILTKLASKRLAGPSLSEKLFPTLLVSTILKMKNERKFKDLALAWVAQSRVNARGVKGNQSLGFLNIRNCWRIKKSIILAGWPENETSGQAKLGLGPVLVSSEPKPSALAEAFINIASAEKIALQILMGKESPLLRPFQGEDSEGIILGVAVRDMAIPAEAVSLADVDS